MSQDPVFVNKEWRSVYRFRDSIGEHTTKSDVIIQTDMITDKFLGERLCSRPC